MKSTTNLSLKRFAMKRNWVILVVATVVILAIGFLVRREIEPPLSTQTDKGGGKAPIRIIQPNPSPPGTEVSAVVPMIPIKQHYPNAKSLDLIPPSPPSNAQHLRVLVEQVLGLDLPKELGWKNGYPEIRMKPVETEKLLEDLASLSRSGFTIPGVVEGVGRGFDSGGFARFHILLETGGSIFRGHTHEDGDKYLVAIQPERGVVKVIFYPGVIRDDQ